MLGLFFLKIVDTNSFRVLNILLNLFCIFYRATLCYAI